MQMPGWVSDLIHMIFGEISFPGKTPPWHDM